MSIADGIFLVIMLALTLGVGFIGGIWTADSVKTWYPTLKKPSWNPPSSVFAPVWTILYILMAVAAWVVQLKGQFFGLAGGLFLVQLALNLAWSFIFFTLKKLQAALIELIVLWFMIASTTIVFFSIDPVAGWLMVPYLAWVTFASTLNAAVWYLNPTSQKKRGGANPSHG